ncbi:MAG: Sua5/YciO/YrdC/YwlC family protein [Candidatus Cloacimonadaceae bacterium]|nr:Sua5/YciO/YrdC/YwlC family protein [Candidatus Cloacimonadota bacterium]
MRLLVQPSIRKLEKTILKNDFKDKTFLHYTGGMYGIGCTVSSQGAIRRILRLKGRDDHKGLIVLVPHLDWFEEEGVHIPPRLLPLIEQYWPGNLSLAFKCDDPRFEHLAVNGKVAFRVPKDDMLRFIIELLDEPIISTSVNIAKLPPENDLKKLTSIYENWFDYGFLPGKIQTNPDSLPSTLVEYIGSDEKGGEELKCLREGAIAFYGVKSSFEKPSIMFVCTANICRSPMAEKLFNHQAAKQGLDFLGDSCGLLPGGESISAGSLQLLLENGILEAKDHISKTCSPEMVQSSRLVLTMEARHRDFLRSNAPDMAEKILTLNEYLGFEGDIADPYGSNIDYYRETFEIIQDRILRLVQKLKNHKAGSVEKIGEIDGN